MRSDIMTETKKSRNTTLIFNDDYANKENEYVILTELYLISEKK